MNISPGRLVKRHAIGRGRTKHNNDAMLWGNVIPPQVAGVLAMLSSMPDETFCDITNAASCITYQMYEHVQLFHFIINVFHRFHLFNHCVLFHESFIDHYTTVICRTSEIFVDYSTREI
jgi:hypothetical protein